MFLDASDITLRKPVDASLLRRGHVERLIVPGNRDTLKAHRVRQN